MASRPVFVYDGDCRFCRRAVTVARRITGDRVEYAPFQEAAPRFPRVPVASFRESIHLIEGDEVWRGAAAVFRGLSTSPGFGAGWWLYRRCPGFAPASEGVYRWVARHRASLEPLLRPFASEVKAPRRHEP